MKLSEQLEQDHNSGDFGRALDGYSERARILEELVIEAGRCPVCSGFLFTRTETPAGDHPELATSWEECNDCDYSGDERPADQSSSSGIIKV